ncbi:hypothetical protein C8Q80DRAFT_47497 [Daedaleopsis nitida]|nr:hypothetical protein C8Q80DRAFT_47497 [Daedaleopsis nitida]
MIRLVLSDHCRSLSSASSPTASLPVPLSDHRGRSEPLRLCLRVVASHWIIWLVVRSFAVGLPNAIYRQQLLRVPHQAPPRLSLRACYFSPCYAMSPSFSSLNATCAAVLPVGKTWYTSRHPLGDLHSDDAARYSLALSTVLPPHRGPPSLPARPDLSSLALPTVKPCPSSHGRCMPTPTCVARHSNGISSLVASPRSPLPSSRPCSTTANTESPGRCRPSPARVRCADPSWHARETSSNAGCRTDAVRLPPFPDARARTRGAARARVQPSYVRPAVRPLSRRTRSPPASPPEDLHMRCSDSAPSDDPCMLIIYRDLDSNLPVRNRR